MKTLKRGAIFGSFDPPTLGHVDLIKRAAKLVDELFVVVAVNANKNPFLPIKERVSLLTGLFSENFAIQVCEWEGLAVKFAKEYNIGFLIRGVRNSSDFSYELNIAGNNNLLDSQIQSLFLVTDPKFEHYSSSLVRELIRAKEDIKSYVPEVVAKCVQ